MAKRFVMCMRCGQQLVDMKINPYCLKCQEEMEKNGRDRKKDKGNKD